VDWQPHAVSCTSVAANFHKTFDVRLKLSSKITFHLTLLVDSISNLANLLFAQLLHPDARSDTRSSHNPLA
jgi:hypothetical protein